MTRFIPMALLGAGLLVAPVVQAQDEPPAQETPADASPETPPEGDEAAEEEAEAPPEGEGDDPKEEAAEEEAPEQAGPSPREQAARRVRTMAMSLREMTQPDARRIRNTADEMAAVGADGVSALVDLLTDPVPAVRLAVVKALGTLKPDGVLASLVARLGDERVPVVLAAVEAVSRYESDFATRALSRWLGHPSEEVRDAVMEALAERDEAQVRGVVRKQLENPPPEVGAGPFLVALGRFPDRRTRRDLFEALEDPDKAPHALRGLAHYGPRAARRLARWVELHPEREVAHQAVQVLVDWGEKGSRQLERVIADLPLDLVRTAVRAWTTADPEGAAERVTELTDHRDAEVRIAALEVIRDVEGADPKEHLGDNLRHRDERVQILAARSVREVGQDEEVEDALIDRYREVARRRTEDDAGMRQALLRSLGQVGRDDAVPELVQAIGHDDEAEAALEALGAVGERAIDSLLFVIKTGDPVRTPLAVKALGNAGKPAVEPLMKLLVHGRRAVRNTARQALAKIGDASIVPQVVQMILDPDTPGRAQLLALLGALYGDESFRALERFALESTEHRIRLGAVNVLSQAPDPRVLPVLRNVAESDDKADVRHLAVEGLVWHGDQEAVPLLIDLLGHERVPIRLTAARGLGYLARPEHVPDIAPQMSTPRDEVITAVRRCLQRITFRTDLEEADQFEDWFEEWEDRSRRIGPLKGAEMALGDGTVLHYALGGDGRPLLVLPGGPDLSYDYLRPALDRLMEEHLLIFVDLPGRGRSTAPKVDGVRLGVAHDVQSVATMLVRLNLREVDVYGHGWGAMVAARLADKHGKLVRRVVLDNSPMPTLLGWTGRIDATAAAIPEPWKSDLPVFEEQARRFQPEVRDQYLAWALMTGAVAKVRKLVDVVPRIRTRPEVRSDIIGGMGAFDLRDAYTRLAKKTLLLYGEETPLPEETEAWRQDLASHDEVSLEILSGAGYLPFHERTGRWHEVVEKFLE
ncbi:MAG: alpha/beta fold hydrolase [Myxococcota bacterium]